MAPKCMQVFVRQKKLTPKWKKKKCKKLIPHNSSAPHLIGKLMVLRSFMFWHTLWCHNHQYKFVWATILLSHLKEEVSRSKNYTVFSKMNWKAPSWYPFLFVCKHPLHVSIIFLCYKYWKYRTIDVKELCTCKRKLCSLMSIIICINNYVQL